MKITNKWLGEMQACSDGRAWFVEQSETNGKKVAEKLVAESKLDWANWLLVRLLNRKQKIRYAIYAAEQVIDLYEKKYPDDKRPREAIEAAKKVMKQDTEVNRNAAYAAAYAAYAAADAAADAADAAYAAAYAADAAYAAAADAATDAATDAEMKKKIIMYGVKLLEKKGGL